MQLSNGIEVSLNVESANRVTVRYLVAGIEYLVVPMDRADGQMWQVGTYTTDGFDYEGAEGELASLIQDIAVGLERDLNPAF